MTRLGSPSWYNIILSQLPKPSIAILVLRMNYYGVKKRESRDEVIKEEAEKKL
jgi:hypothetical protein